MFRQPTIALLTLLCTLAFSAPTPAEEKPPTPREKALAAKLDRKLPEVTLTGLGLADVLDFMRDIAGPDIFADWIALEKIGIGKDTPVTLKLKDVTFREFFTQMTATISTKKGQAQFTPDDGMLVISAVPDPKNPPAKITVTIPEPVNRILTEVNFNGQELAAVFDFLRDVGEIKIAVDWHALEAAGINKDAPVNLRLKNAPLSFAIRWILQSVSDGKTPLQCTNNDGVIAITTTPKPKPQK